MPLTPTFTPAAKDASNVDPADWQDTVNNAMALDPAAARSAAWVPYIYAEDYGVVYTTSDDTTAAANSTALSAAFAASALLGQTLIISGWVYTKGVNLVSGVGVRVHGEKNARIIQKSLTDNGITLDTVTPPYGLVWEDVDIYGQGSATHNAAGVYGRRGDNSYLTSDLIFRDMNVFSFRTGFDFAAVTKFQTDNVTVANVRVGINFLNIQDYALIMSRIVSGDADAASRCVNINGGSYGGTVIGGEFGGVGFANFAVMTAGKLDLQGCNLENFSGDQVFDLPGTGNAKFLEIRNCRISQARTATQAIVSCQVSGANGFPKIVFQNNEGWSGGRELEIWGNTGGSLVNRPKITGQEIPVTYCATKGSAALITRKELDNTPVRILAGEGRTAIASGTDVVMHTLSVPANYIIGIGETLRMRAFGTTAANDNNKQFKFVGNSGVFDFGAIAMNNESWVIDAEILNASWGGGSGNWKVCAVLTYGSTSITKCGIIAGNSDSVALTVSLKGTSTASGDIIMLGAKTTTERDPTGF